MVKTLPFHQALTQLDLPGLERNLFSSPAWMEVIYRTYGSALFVKYIERDGRVASYILYSAVRNFLEWKICISSYCDYCDCYVNSADDWRLFFASLREDYPAYRIAIRNLRDEYVRQVPELSVLSKEKYHYLDVRDDIEAVWKRAHDSFKAAVRQGERNGVVVRACPKEDLRKFYDLHLKVRKNKYHIFPQPYRFFDIIWQEYMEKDKGVLLGAFSPTGEFIAGNVYLECGNTLYYKFNTSSVGGLKFRPNNLLFWEGIKLAKSRGLEYVDLGSSGNHQKGLIMFKDHTGAANLDITHLGYTPAGYKFSEKKILRVMTRLFTLPVMPNFMVRWGSGLIYPYLA